MKLILTVIGLKVIEIGGFILVIYLAGLATKVAFPWNESLNWFEAGFIGVALLLAGVGISILLRELIEANIKWAKKILNKKNRR